MSPSSAARPCSTPPTYALPWGLQRRGTPQVFEDQRGLRARHVGVGIEVLHDERPQVIGVTRGDVKDEIVGSGQEVDVHDLRPGPDVPNEAADLAARIGL